MAALSTIYGSWGAEGGMYVLWGFPRPFFVSTAIVVVFNPRDHANVDVI